MTTTIRLRCFLCGWKGSQKLTKQNRPFRTGLGYPSCRVVCPNGHGHISGRSYLWVVATHRVTRDGAKRYVESLKIMPKVYAARKPPAAMTFEKRGEEIKRLRRVAHLLRERIKLMKKGHERELDREVTQAWHRGWDRANQD